MRADYLLEVAVFRLAVTRTTKRQLLRIRNRFFPSFSEGSVVRLLAGLYVRRHQLRVKSAATEEVLSALEASDDQECVELHECDEEDFRIMGAIVARIKRTNGRFRSTALLKALVESF